MQLEGLPSWPSSRAAAPSTIGHISAVSSPRPLWQLLWTFGSAPAFRHISIFDASSSFSSGLDSVQYDPSNDPRQALRMRPKRRMRIWSKRRAETFEYKHHSGTPFSALANNVSRIPLSLCMSFASSLNVQAGRRDARTRPAFCQAGSHLCDFVWRVGFRKTNQWLASLSCWSHVIWLVLEKKWFAESDGLHEKYELYQPIKEIKSYGCLVCSYATSNMSFNWPATPSHN